MSASKTSFFRRGKSAMSLPSRVRARTETASGAKTRITHPAGVWCGPSTAKGSELRAAAIASSSWSPALQPSPTVVSTFGSAYRHERGAPDFLCVFGNCSIGGEPADIGRVQNARTQPTVPITPSFVDLDLSAPVSVEVGADHKIIVMGKRVDETTIASGIVGREHAGGDFVERFVQDWGGGDVCGRIDALGARGLDFRRGHAENEDIVVADQIAHLDIGAVESADGQGAVERHLRAACARGFHAGGGDLLGQVGGGHDDLGQRNIVV